MMILERRADDCVSAEEKIALEQWFARKVGRELDKKTVRNVYPQLVNRYYAWRGKGLIPETFFTLEEEISLRRFFIEYLIHIYHVHETPYYEKKDEDFDTAEFFNEFLLVVKSAYDLELKEVQKEIILLIAYIFSERYTT